MNQISDDELRKYVRQFLEDFKNLVLEKDLTVTDRLKNRDALIELGLTPKQRTQIILELSVTDYHAGPIKDKYKPGDYYEFGKDIGGFEVYVKLRIVDNHGEENAYCYSFHKAERALSYRFATK